MTTPRILTVVLLDSTLALAKRTKIAKNLDGAGQSSFVEVIIQFREAPTAAYWQVKGTQFCHSDLTSRRLPSAEGVAANHTRRQGGRPGCDKLTPHPSCSDKMPKPAATTDPNTECFQCVGVEAGLQSLRPR